MYSLDIRPELDKKLSKLVKRNRKQYDAVVKKSGEIIANPHHYKNLNKPLQHLKRVHIDTNFVLTFSVCENHKTVILEDIGHHDEIYR